MDGHSPGQGIAVDVLAMKSSNRTTLANQAIPSAHDCHTVLMITVLILARWFSGLARHIDVMVNWFSMGHGLDRGHCLLVRLF